MADINISVDSREVAAASRDIKDLEKSFGSAYKSAEVFMTAFARTEKINAYVAQLQNVAKANQELINKNLGVTNSYKSAEKSAESFTQVLKNQEAQARKFTASFNESVGITGYYKSAAESAAVFERAAKEESDAWFAQQRRRLAMMQESDRMMQKSTGVFGRFGFAAQQVGYQVGDFFVQVQSGTNVLVAFGQQFTQLAGLLTLSANPAIMAWGVALSIVVPLVTALGAAWMRTSEDTKKSVDKISEAIKGLQSDIEKAELDNIKVGFNTEFDSIALAKKQIQEVQNQIDNLRKNPEVVSLFAGQQLPMDYNNQGAVAKEEEKRAALEDQLKVLYQQLRVSEGLKAIEEASALQNKIKLNAIDKQKEEQEKLLRYHAQQLDYMGKTKQESDNFKNALIAAYGVLAQSKTAAAILADQMGRAADNAYRMSTVGLGAYTLKEGYGPMMMGRGQPATGAPTTSLTTQQLADAYGLYGYTRSLNMQPPKTSKGGGGGGGSKPKTFDEYIKGLEEELATKQKLIGLYGISAEIEKARADAAEALNKTVDKLNPKEIERIDALTKQTYALEQQQQLMDTVQSNMSDAFMSMVDGSKSVHKAFKDMMFNILKSIYEHRVLTPMTNALTSMLFSANGNVFNNGSVQAFASGGVVGSPTLFPMAGGKTGLMGEAGPEAIVPLKRGPDGKLGVASSGGGSITVNNVINVTGTGDAAYVRSEVAKMMPQITGATKAAVIDARKRGGQMAAAFR